MRHTEPDSYHGYASLGCLITLSGLAGLAVLCYGLYKFGALVIALIQNHF